MSQIKRPISSLKPIPEDYIDNNKKNSVENNELYIVMDINSTINTQCANPNINQANEIKPIKTIEPIKTNEPCKISETNKEIKNTEIDKEVKTTEPIKEIKIINEKITNTKIFKNNDKKWSQLVAFILWLIVLTIVFWLIFYSLSPKFVLKADTNEPDLSKVLFYAFIFALIILIFIWIIKLCVA